MIKFSPVSDIVHAIPVASAIKRHLPTSKLIWLTDEPGIELLKGHLDIDYLFAWKRHEWIRDFPYPHRIIPVIWEILQMLNRLRHHRIDAVLDLEASSISAMLSQWTSAPQRIRFDSIYPQKAWTRHFYTQLLRIPKCTIHNMNRNLKILNGIGIHESRIYLETSIPQESEREADQFLQSKTPDPEFPIVGIYPGSDYRNRSWQDWKFAEMSDILTNRFGINCLLLWFPGELDLIKSIERRMTTLPFRAYPARGRSMLSLIKRCHLLIAPDSAIIAMANLLKVPVLGLFGPTSPQKRGPIGPNDRTIQGKMPCVPCERLYCENPLCMDSIRVKHVVENVVEMIRKKDIRENRLKKRGG